MPKPTKITVRYAETDRMGVVYHANYLVWFDVARTEFLQELGFPYDKIEEQGYMAPVLEAHVNYGQSFTFGDTALIIVYFTKNIPYVTIIAKKIRTTTPIARQTLIKLFASFISLYIEDSFSLFKFFSLTSCTSISLTNSSNVNPK